MVTETCLASDNDQFANASYRSRRPDDVFELATLHLRRTGISASAHAGSTRRKTVSSAAAACHPPIHRAAFVSLRARGVPGFFATPGGPDCWTATATVHRSAPLSTVPPCLARRRSSRRRTGPAPSSVYRSLDVSYGRLKDTIPVDAGRARLARAGRLGLPQGGRSHASGKMLRRLPGAVTRPRWRGKRLRTGANAKSGSKSLTLGQKKGLPTP